MKFLRRIINYTFRNILLIYNKLSYLLIPASFLKKRTQQLVNVKLNGFDFKSYNIDKIDQNNFNNLINNFQKIINISKCELNTAIDIGANFGFYSCALSKIGFNNIFSLEPNPKVFQIMENNFKKNNLNNIIPLPFGIFNESKELPLSYPKIADKKLDKKSDKYSSGTLSLKGSGKDVIHAKFKKLKDVSEFQKMDACNLIKIDVEGSEVEVLKEIRPILENFKPVIIMELNVNYLNEFNFDIIKKIILENNYTNFIIFGESFPKIISSEIDIFINKLLNKKIGSKDIVFY